MQKKIIVNPFFEFKHFTTDIQCGDMKDASQREAFLLLHGIKRADLVLAGQVHSSNVKVVTKNDRGSLIDNCDGLITAEKSLTLGIFTADCMPVLMASKCGQVKAAVHAGWRGLAAGILEKTAELFKSGFGINPEDIKVYIAPHIQECCYEVGSDFGDNFGIKLANNKFDLSKTARNILIKCGLKSVQVSHFCTVCDKDSRFFSYRKNKTLKRQITVI